MADGKPEMSENRGGTCGLLCVSPFQEDHQSLGHILADRNWTVHHASTLCGARNLLRDHSYSLIVCERDMPPDTWKDVLVEVASLPKPPFFIVTSLHADDSLWAEALNWGAYDVLMKPFQNTEVVRAVNMASLHWNYRNPPAKMRARTATG